MGTTASTGAAGHPRRFGPGEVHRRAGSLFLLFPAAAVMVGAAAGAAQGTGSLAGRVTLDGEGVPGILIELPVLQGAHVTDAEGRFLFPEVPPGRHEVRAAMVGCRAGSWTVDVAADRQLELDVRLDGPAVRPGAVVRSGVAGDTPDDELPFTVERLTRDQIERNPARSVTELIRGAFPGVKVVRGSGLPGAGPAVQMRGPTSISLDDQPLVIVDGMISAGELDDMHPMDIESIEVLKGSAASALYGSRGEAGVIAIETRTGKAGEAGCVFRGGPSS